MQVKTKYPMKIGGSLIPKDTIGIIAPLEEVRKTFPNIGHDSNSNQIAVKFLDLDWCIVDKFQLKFNE